MQDDDTKPGRPAAAKDPVDEASGGSFPASDPPPWTATRAGEPESAEDKAARAAAERTPPLRCEAIALFASEASAQAAADALLCSGFNLVEIGPPHTPGNLAAGIGARLTAERAQALGRYAALGALTAGAVAALLMPRGARFLLAAAAGGAVGAIAARTAGHVAERRGIEPGWPRTGMLLRVKLTTAEDRKRALAIIEDLGALKIHMSWPEGC